MYECRAYRLSVITACVAWQQLVTKAALPVRQRCNTAPLHSARLSLMLKLGSLLSVRAQVRDVSENPLARPEITKHHSDDPQMETRILENSINKICSLLAVGFGDAGAEVIANNIRSGGDLNPMIPGNKVMAVFGFCDIRNFTDTTEVLQEDIMEFVNTIADIVHTEVRVQCALFE